MKYIMGGNKMRKFKMAVRRFILKRRIKACELRMSRLRAGMDNIHQLIIHKIRKGDGGDKLEGLRCERKGLFDELMELIDKKYDLVCKLERAA
jgi:hypothetical protein